MATSQIALAAGDGIGPEIMDAVLGVFRTAGVLDQLEFVPVEMGKEVFARGDTRGMTNEAIRTVERCGLLFKGPMETPKGGGGKSINVTARKIWNAFANLRHFRTLPGVETPYSRAGIHVNFHIVRENIEDTYGGVETRLTADMVEGKRFISAPGCDEVCEFAFETATTLGLTKVHCGHKANIMKLTDGLFLERFKAAAAKRPAIEAGDVIVDALCMNLVMKPQQYQMVVLPNLQGDIVSDLAAGLVGGLGFAPSANIGKFISIFEAVHGTAPDIAGKGIANPTSLLLSGIMLLRHVGMLRQAAHLENALLKALEDGVRTGDFGDRSRPALGTEAFARAIAERLGEKPTTVPAVTVPEADRPQVRPPACPSQQFLVRTFGDVNSAVVGCDLTVEAALPTADLAAALAPLAEGTPLRLTLLSNRGTQVWPTGSVYTECVDCWQARFEFTGGPQPIGSGQAEVLRLAARVAERFPVPSLDLLRNFAGVRGYALAQGQ